VLPGDGSPEAAAPLADEMFDGGLRLYFTRELEAPRRERNAGAPDARYRLLAPSKDKTLPRFSVDNSFLATWRLSSSIGRWSNAPQDDPHSAAASTPSPSSSAPRDGALSRRPRLGLALRPQ